jgi:L-alanine-DL-glutamate epimerase-like enolase superfamily enzyme
VGCCAVECALHDLVGKLTGQPTWRLLGLAGRTPETSYTLGIDSVDGTADRARRASAAGYRRLKIKLGGAADLERLEAIRSVCDLPLRVDANEGWDLAEARELMPVLAALGVELIEQPFPAGEQEAFRELRAFASGIPLVVDEGCHTLSDVAEVATYADGVNLKLAKTGGIREAVRMVHAARALGLVVMLGCMIESSLGISAAAQFASLCDFVDLDGHLLIADDPAEGLGFEDGRIVLSQRPGLGVEPLA